MKTLKQLIIEKLASYEELSFMDMQDKTNLRASIDRPLGYKHGKKGMHKMEFNINYGNFPKLINPADGEPWDVVIPGIHKSEKKIKVGKIIGMVPMRNGNHKLIGLPKGHTFTDKHKDQVKEYISRKRNQEVINNEPRHMSEEYMSF
jgi:inorganic pyrophosphatase|tara:strand:+ start:452 stop:892 length:441 start_codon:yes stop_codon:yes gene_type:complete